MLIGDWPVGSDMLIGGGTTVTLLAGLDGGRCRASLMSKALWRSFDMRGDADTAGSPFLVKAWRVIACTSKIC